jgi:hypothetical protein
VGYWLREGSLVVDFLCYSLEVPFGFLITAIMLYCNLFWLLSYVLFHIALFPYKKIEKYKKYLSSLPEDGFSTRNHAGCDSKHLYITPNHRYIIAHKPLTQI